MILDVSPTVRPRVPRALVRAMARGLRRSAQRLGAGHRLPTLSVRLVDDAEMALLHGRFMGEPVPTDVLSFEPETLPGTVEASLGDLVLDFDAVVRQAPAATLAAWSAEATTLAIHGLVHLLGHDHATRPQARQMLRAEVRAHRVAGLGKPHRGYPRGYAPGYG